MTRRFEFVGGTSAKFWEVGVTGATVTVRVRPTGHRGSNPNQVAGRPCRRGAHAAKLIGEKIGKGYRETSVI